MVRLHGPAHAREALGSLAGSLTFSSNKGRAYLKKHTKPRNPDTPDQRALRAAAALISTFWQHTTAAERQSWDDLAASLKISNLDACLGYNVTRARHYQTPTLFYPPDLTGAWPNFASPTVKAQGRQFEWTINITTVGDALALVMFLCTSSAYTRAWNRIVHYIPIISPGPIVWRYGPLTPGTYYMSLDFCLRRGRRPGGVYNRTVTIA